MFKLIAIMTMSFVAMYVFTGCVQDDVQLQHSERSKNNWANQSSADDVDVSDLDETLTESEMMMSEEGSGNKIERMAFPASEYYTLQKMGKGTVRGTIYMKDAYLGGHEMKKADARLFNYLKFTASDSNGAFEFYGVPSGSYYLIGTVKCGQECGYDSVKNIRIATRVDIQGNQIVEKDLTRILE